MNYHPISLNVMRQALRLSGCPQPARIHTIDRATQPTGCVWSLYELIFSYQSAVAIVPYHDYNSKVWSAMLADKAKDFFCNDIQVMNVIVGWKHQPVSVFLLTKFDPKVKE